VVRGSHRETLRREFIEAYTRKQRGPLRDGRRAGRASDAAPRRTTAAQAAVDIDIRVVPSIAAEATGKVPRVKNTY
jgi:hypothetical protein